MTKDFTLKYLYVISATLIGLLAIAFYFELPPVLVALPFVLLIGYCFIFRLDVLFWMVAFLAPLSIGLENLDFASIGMFLPTEPILLGLLLIAFGKTLFSKTNSLTLKHPFFALFLVYFLWIGFTTITSTNPVVSLKYLISRMWLIIPIFFFGLQLFKKVENIKRFLWLYLAGFTIVIVYTLTRHASFGFSEQAGHWVMSPFFKDHTSYGAIIALLFPLVIVLFQMSKRESVTRFFLVLLSLLFAVALYYSYTRAAWASVIGGLGVWFLVKYRIKWKYLFLGAFGFAIFIMANYVNLSYTLKKNESEHATEDLSERIQSMSNITTDASNLERINRWVSAINMFEEKPLVGFGPGTYAMEYAPYQDPQKKSIISTNFGDMGTAHSEYLGALSEMGLPGMLIFIALVFVIFYKAITLYYRIVDPELKRIVLALIVGLSTYFAHSALNNYLDTDKAAVPVWGFCAIIMAIELYHKEKML